MRRSPRGVARKPDKRGLKAGLPRCHVWKAGIHIRVDSWASKERQSTHLPTHIPDRRPGPPPFRWPPSAGHTCPGPARHATSIAAGAASLVQQPTEPSPEQVEGTPREAGRVAGAATRRPATSVVGVGGEFPPSCPCLKSLRLYSAKTDSHPLPDPPVRGPPPPAASPCVNVRLRRPRSRAVPPTPRLGRSRWGWGGGGAGVSPSAR